MALEGNFIACPYTLAKMVDPGRHFGSFWLSPRRLVHFSQVSDLGSLESVFGPGSTIFARFVLFRNVYFLVKTLTYAKLNN